MRPVANQGYKYNSCATEGYVSGELRFLFTFHNWFSVLTKTCSSAAQRFTGTGSSNVLFFNPCLLMYNLENY